MADRKERITLEAEGIVCTGCAMDMEAVLRDTEGIFDVEVRYADGRILIDHDPAEISRAAVIAKVQGFGFKIQVKD